MLPNFVIIGAQKSASTFLQVCLREHPEVYMPESETPFFESPDYENSSLDELKRLFRYRNEKRLGIKRPTYIGKSEVPERIGKDLPDARLIAVLRNPLNRAVSAYHHYIKYGFIPPIAVESGLRRILTDPFFKKKYSACGEIIEFGLYFKYLREYKHFFVKNQMLILLHEDIVSKPLESIQKVFRFLDIDSNFVPASLKSRPQKVIYDLLRLRVLSFQSRFLYDYNQDRTRLSVKNQNLIDKIFDKIVSILDQKVISRFFDDKKPEISFELRKSLYEIYRKDIDALEYLLERDLSGWKL